jgi:hypothetical protein
MVASNMFFSMKFKMLGGASKLVSDQLLSLFPGHKQWP